MTVALILFLLFFILFLGVPIAFGLGTIGLGLMIFGDISPLMIPQTFYSVADNFILLAVPMFLMMSNILLKAGVGEDLFKFAQSWVGNFPGGLAIATIVSCSIFAAISGSSVATAATISTVARAKSQHLSTASTRPEARGSLRSSKAIPSGLTGCPGTTRGWGPGSSHAATAWVAPSL